jgi:hypothetical protein
LSEDSLYYGYRFQGGFMKSLLLTIITVIFMLSALFAEQVVVNNNANQVQIVLSDDSQSILHYTLGNFDRTPVTINGRTYYQLQLKNEAVTYDKGYPELPTVSRSIIIPGTAKMDLEILSSQYVEYPISVIPSKGALTRNIDPDQVPYTFGEVYDINAYYPSVNTHLSEPYILRDFRGITVTFEPFSINPQTGVLRVYTDIMVKIMNTGFDTINTMPRYNNSYSNDFEAIYTRQFMNFNPIKYVPVDEIGKLLVICPTQYLTTIQPYVDWKRQKGFTTDLVEFSTIGTTAAAIQTYIQNRYNQDNSLTFVQLVGDAAQMPTLSSGGGGADPVFSLVAGTDSYPDIFIGRFSAENVAQLQTQVTRTIYYERDMPETATWLGKAIGIASNQGGGSQGDLGESDQVHMENIRTKLTNYNYHTYPVPGTSTVDQVYEANGATTTQISNGLNQGRGWINYCGHGSDTSWGTTGFSNTNVNALTNENMLPFIVSVACVNGNFTNLTCFAEAWLRATHNNNPTGAIAAYMSSINQSWNSPMRAEDEIADLLTQNLKYSIGGLFYNGSCKMIDVYGADGISMFKTWHVFGDVSLQVRTKAPIAMTVTHDPALVIGMNTFTVNTGVSGALVSLSGQGIVYGAAYADASGQAVLNLTNLPEQPVDLILTVTAFDKVTNFSTIQMIAGSGPYIVISSTSVSDGNNHQADLGESLNWNLSLSNIGSVAATAVTVTASTEDQYITILNNTAAVAEIAPQESVITQNGIRLQIANNVPDQHVATIHVTIVNSDNTTWNYDPLLLICAPAFQFGNFEMDDSQGNNNGRVDAGETVMIEVPFTNVGHTTALATTVMIDAQTQNVLITPINNVFDNIVINGTENALFVVTFSSQIPAGTHVTLHCTVTSGDLTIESNIDVVVGIIMEDFETGTMSEFPWSFTGGNWILTTAGAYSGTYSAKSAAILNNASTSMQVTIAVPVAGNVSFYSKTSSELNYDYLRFFIDGIQKEQWSGETPWAQHTYPVTAGQVTFKWQYIKDGSTIGGSDCAWVDNVVFPTVGGIPGTPVFTLSSENMIFGEVTVGNHTIQQITISNNGNAIMIGTITGSDIFTIALTETTTPNVQVPYVLQAGQSVIYDITFTPADTTMYNQQIVITSDDPAHPTNSVTVSGQGVPVENNDPNVLPSVTALLGNYPNPFNPETNIAFSLKEMTKVKIEIYNVLGQKVRTLLDKELPAGMNTVRWNGKDDSGKGVGSGVYFMKMHADRFTSTKKMIMLK